MVVSCGLCYIKCLEKICDYINEAAFAYMAVSGEGFCTSAWHAFLLHLKHTMKFAWANLIAAVFIFLGKAGLTMFNCWSLYMFMSRVYGDTEEVSSLLGPMVVVACITYLTTCIFLGMFETVV